MMDALREVLAPWLGEPRTKQNGGRVTFVYRFHSEDVPPIPLRLKVETNTREHFSAFGLTQVPFGVRSRWFEGSCMICSYELDELLGTKLRALYQRKAGRDLFDLAVALNSGKVDKTRIVSAFLQYMEHGGHTISRALFEKHLAEMMRDPRIPRGYQSFAIQRLRMGSAYGSTARLIEADRTAPRRALEGQRSRRRVVDDPRQTRHPHSN
jgi:hypothetical protein